MQVCVSINSMQTASSDMLHARFDDALRSSLLAESAIKCSLYTLGQLSAQAASPQYYSSKHSIALKVLCLTAISFWQVAE